MAEEAAKRPRVVIVGAGFGGIAAAKALVGKPVDVTIIDKRNYHLFQPLLYQVATADLSPADVAWPIRGIFSRAKNVSVLLGRVADIDVDKRQVIAGEFTVGYDYLILATGSRHAYFGKDEWEPYAPGLKRITDATELRKRILVAFERAETARSADEQRRQLNFVVIGGGPTGVEMAGAIAELANWSLAKDFRHIDPTDARVILVEAGPRVLGGLDKDLSDYARQALEKLGVEVLLNSRVEECSEMGVKIGDEFLPCATIIWGAGVTVPNLSGWLDVETDHSGRIPVGGDLTLEGHPEIFVIGDASQVPWKEGEDVPGIAPAAKQEGQYAAKAILSHVADRPAPKPFRYRHMGNLATIGRHSAVVDLGGYKLKGGLAWWFWGLAHIYFLIEVRSAITVALQWFWSYLTASKGARLITGLEPLFAKSETGKAAPRKLRKRA